MYRRNVIHLNSWIVSCESFVFALIICENLFFLSLALVLVLARSRLTPANLSPSWSARPGSPGLLWHRWLQDTPSTIKHPAFGQLRGEHVLNTHRLACDWPVTATPLTLIGCVLPAARLMWGLFLRFFCLCQNPNPSSSAAAAAPSALPPRSSARWSHHQRRCEGSS